MGSTKHTHLVMFGLFVLVFGGCATVKPVSERVAGRTYPSIFQAWNPIDMNTVALATNEERLAAAAKHDLLWEEPVSQLGYGVDLVLGAVWDHAYGGLATQFTAVSRKQALKNRKAMLKMNPHMIMLMEIRWKDAPGSFLPEDSDWWMREADGSRKQGWTGGPEPYYYLNYQDAGFRRRIAEQAGVAVGSGVYDGIMLDWWGSHGENEPNALDFLAQIREAIGPDALIIVNNDRIAPLPNSAPYVNGAFMEMHQRWRAEDTSQRWLEIREHLLWFEENLRKPVVNCLEIQAGPESDMRAGLAMALIFTDGYYLFANSDNSDPAPDHLHRWFDIYDVELGRPTGPLTVPRPDRPEGTVYREYEGGIVFYNPLINLPITMDLGEAYLQVSTGEVNSSFTVNKGDGEILLKASPSEQSEP